MIKFVFIASLTIVLSSMVRTPMSGPIAFENVDLKSDSLKARIELGRNLFYDKVLSRDSSLSCGSCHKQHLAFTDGEITSIGFKGQRVSRNAPTLTNVKDLKTLLWDGVNPNLEEQVRVPIQEHLEFDFHIVLIAERLKKNDYYMELTKKAYNRIPDTYTITHSIAEFERTLVSDNSRFDQYTRGEISLNDSEERGRKLFMEELYCTECHSGPNFTNETLTNNGLYEFYADSGRMRKTEVKSDRGIFKTPTLRNIALTAPYMHDGVLPSLGTVIDHYASGGKNHFNKSEIIQPFQLTLDQKNNLIAFLKTLTDQDFITNPEYSDPNI